MKTTLMLPLAALIGACSIAPANDPPPAPEPPRAAPPAITAAPATTARTQPETGIRATDDVVPADVKLTVRRVNEHRWDLHVARKGYLVALRQGSERAVGDGEADLQNAVSTARGVPIVWEATDPVTLVTTRGLVDLDTEGEARLRSAEAPLPVASETRRRHACRAHEDGFGGFVAVCRVRGFAGAESVTRSSSRDGVWSFARADRTMIRADLGGDPGTVDAVTLGYAEGAEGVVVRVEASRAAGEDQAAIAILSADRRQPAGSFPMMKHPPRDRRFIEIDF